MSVIVEDYDPQNPRKENITQDPTDPEETVERKLMDKLAVTITRFEELLNAGDSDMTIGQLQQFMSIRGDALDALDDPMVAKWLQDMRTSSRCPFRRFTIG